MWIIFALVFIALSLVVLILMTKKRTESKFDRTKAILMVGMFFVGGLSNKAVIAVNSNKMPVSLTAMKMAPFCSDKKIDKKIAELKDNRDDSHCLMTEKTKLRFLADIIPSLSWVYSAGDILLLSGLILLGIWFLRRGEFWSLPLLIYGILGFIF